MLINVRLGKEGALFWRVCDTCQKADCVNKVKKEENLYVVCQPWVLFSPSDELHFLDWSPVKEDLTVLHFHHINLQNNRLFDPVLLTIFPCVNLRSICTNNIPVKLCLMLQAGYNLILPLAVCKTTAALWKGARFAPKLPKGMCQAAPDVAKYQPESTSCKRWMGLESSAQICWLAMLVSN